MVRLGVPSLVLEQAESLRTTGTSLTLFKNGWRVLDAIGVANDLRPQFLEIQGYIHTHTHIYNSFDFLFFAVELKLGYVKHVDNEFPMMAFTISAVQDDGEVGRWEGATQLHFQRRRSKVWIILGPSI